MNTDFKKGNVIASATDFNNFRFPHQLPTEEWGGDEVRSYFNYIRPIANLFENDRENLDLSKEILSSLIYKDNKNAVVSGCEITKTILGGNSYYEVGKGIFLNEGTVYHIFPECEAVAKQIKKEYILASNSDIDIKIWYDGVYHYDYITEDGIQHDEGTANSATILLYNILSNINVPNTEEDPEEIPLINTYPIENHIILPIFKNINNVEISFDGSIAPVNTESTTRTIFGKIVNGTVNTDDVIYFTINGDIIEKGSSYIELGATRCGIGQTVTKIAGLTSINNIRLSTDGITLVVSDGNHSVSTKANYTLGNACEKAYSVTFDNSDDKLPTVSAVKAYVSNQITNKTEFPSIHVTTGGASIDAGGLSVVAGGATISGNLTSNDKLRVKSNAPASKSGGNLSMNASISTDGGIEAKGDIYANGSIVGTNSGVYSLRKLKENITPFEESALDLIKDIDIVNFNYISDPEKNRKVGFIADDTNELFATKNHNIMDQANCIGLLLKAVQELAAENAELKERLSHVIDA